ncbi:MAG TPA: CapA family protein, partial [Anaerolineae bacterium]|nr:CapA family protein [Anaerolineae bacterium]
MPAYRLLALAVLAGLIGACASVAPTPAPSPTALPTSSPSPTPPPTATPTPLPDRLYVDPSLPADLAARVSDVVAAHHTDFALTTDSSGAAARIAYSAPVDLPQIGQCVFALVSAFPTRADDVPWADVEAAWHGALDHGPLRMSQATYAALSVRYGEAATGAVEIVGADQLVDVLWNDRAAWGIVPFDDLDPRLKVLSIDGRSPLRRNLDLNAYPLVVDVAFNGDLDVAAKLLSAFGEPYTNRDESRMTVLGLTGVTALTRDLALVMDRAGVLYPAEKIRPWLEEVDILHVSNEVSFTPQCQILSGTVVFCSKPEYFDLLKSIGTDVIENTGNHMNDWGTRPFSETLGMYREAGIGYYGGGYDLIDAARPLTITDHGNLIGFVGCNPNGPDGAWATDMLPGAYPCR